MKRIQEKDKFSIAYCRTILNKNGKNYSDEQIIRIRDFLYLLAEIEVDYAIEQEQIKGNEKSSDLHSSIE